MASKHFLKPTDGEVLKLSVPARGELVIKVDPKQGGTLFAMGTQTLLTGEVFPVHRHLHRDVALFVHKGQGRVTLEGQAMTVVPGMAVSVPRHTWHGLRNTGTGVLQVAWVSAPPGLEEFFRELSRADRPLDPNALEELARRHGIEFRPEAQTQEPSAPRRGHRRRHLDRGPRAHTDLAQPPVLPEQGQQPAPVSGALVAAPPASQPPPGQLPAAAAKERQGSRPRHHRRRRRGGAGLPAPNVVRQAGRVPAETGLRQAASGQPSRPAASQPHRNRRDPRRRRGRVKEVYMGGRWIQVTGEGPVIAAGP